MHDNLRLIREELRSTQKSAKASLLELAHLRAAIAHAHQTVAQSRAHIATIRAALSATSVRETEHVHYEAVSAAYQSSSRRISARPLATSLP
jgi:hypothetical protein